MTHNTDTAELALFIRKMSLQMCSIGKSSHIGSILSCADILAVLFGIHFKNDLHYSKNQADRFVMSKGHAGAALYSTLCALGYVDEALLRTHYQNGSFLSGHVCHKLFPGIDFSTGSLGHGLPVCIGRSLFLREREPNATVFCLMSDGELNEGSNWEAFLSAAHHKLGNLIAIIDRNRLQSIEDTETTLALEPLEAKLTAFGWNVATCNGNDHASLSEAFDQCINFQDGPSIVIANTTKGYGVSFMENEVLWHYRSPDGYELAKALEELA